MLWIQNGEIHETEEQTEMWAWKNQMLQTKMKCIQDFRGDVTFDGVDFGYNPDKIVLHDIKMFAKPGQKLAFVGFYRCRKDNNYQPY